MGATSAVILTESNYSCHIFLTFIFISVSRYRYHANFDIYILQCQLMSTLCLFYLSRWTSEIGKRNSHRSFGASLFMSDFNFFNTEIHVLPIVFSMMNSPPEFNAFFQIKISCTLNDEFTTRIQCLFPDKTILH